MKEQRKKTTELCTQSIYASLSQNHPFSISIFTHTQNKKKIHSTQQVALQATKLPHDNGGKININGNVVMFDDFRPSFDRRLSNG